MYFEIQVGRPFIRRSLNEEREDLSSAILAAFPENTEDAILVWNWIPVRVNYNCDLSVIMEDLLFMLDDLMNSNRGSAVTFFGSATFRANWSVTWDEEMLRIDAKWESVAGRYEDLLNSRGVLEVKKDEFFCEWKGLLRKVSEAIAVSGIRVVDDEQITLLRRLETAIPKFGRLYEPGGLKSEN